MSEGRFESAIQCNVPKTHCTVGTLNIYSDYKKAVQPQKVGCTVGNINYI